MDQMQEGETAMRLTDKERELAKRAAARYLERAAEETACRNCQGQGHIASGIALDGPESCGDGHACFAPCPACGGTGKGEMQ